MEGNGFHVYSHAYITNTTEYKNSNELPTTFTLYDYAHEHARRPQHYFLCI